MYSCTVQVQQCPVSSSLCVHSKVHYDTSYRLCTVADTAVFIVLLDSLSYQLLYCTVLTVLLVHYSLSQRQSYLQYDTVC